MLEAEKMSKRAVDAREGAHNGENFRPLGSAAPELIGDEEIQEAALPKQVPLALGGATLAVAFDGGLCEICGQPFGDFLWIRGSCGDRVRSVALGGSDQAHRHAGFKSLSEDERFDLCGEAIELAMEAFPDFDVDK